MLWHKVLMTSKRIFMLGATGTIGRATRAALISRGHELVCFARKGAKIEFEEESACQWRFGDVTDMRALQRDGFRGEKFDILLSCMASRTGSAKDAWAIDYQAHLNALECAQSSGVTHMVLLSAICVQRPKLAFQHAKLAFEAKLIASDLDYSIVRPTAFFKSLSGQIERVKNGKAFLLFGDGKLTECKPISDDDLAEYLAETVNRPELRNRILPIGGPGPALTPRQQGTLLFSLLQQEPRFRHVPVALMDIIIGALSAVGNVIPAAAAKAELARIGRYYATESMLLWDPATGGYTADATPSTGHQTLADHYQKILAGERAADLGDHAIF
jgi:divinyl chlorophyllide a 8-vinyl-reductase